MEDRPYRRRDLLASSVAAISLAGCGGQSNGPGATEPGASPDGQEPEGTPPEDVGIRHERYDGPVGGGEGMPSDAIHVATAADTIVEDGELQTAIDDASPGDVIYVRGQARASAVTTDDITIAGNRGFGEDGHIDNPDIEAKNVRFDGLVLDVPGRLFVGEPGFTCFNCELSGAGHIELETDSQFEPAMTFKQCEIHDFETYKTFQGGYLYGDDVTACGDSFFMPGEEQRIRLLYNEWYGNSKIAGTQFFYEVADNHFKETATSGAFLELRAPNECRVSGSGSVNDCGSPCGTAIIEHNLNEMMHDSDDVGVRLVQIRGTPWQATTVVRNNEAPVNSSWDAGCEANDTFDHAQFSDQIALQNAGDAGARTLDNVVVENNYLG